MSLPFTKPVVNEAINKLVFQWPTYDLRLIANRIDDKGVAELWVYHSNGNGDQLLHSASVNLLSTTTMERVEKRLQKNSTDIPWMEVLTYVAKTAIEYQRSGEPGEIIKPYPGAVEHPGYYIEPILLKGLPTIIHGEKGINKTTLGLTMLGLLYNSVNDPHGLRDDNGDFTNPSGLIANEQARVGILDWENDKNTTIYNISNLIRAKTVPYFEPAYLRCSLALSDDIDRIGNFIMDKKLDVILIDSLGQAAGSEQFDQAGKRAALRFFESLRRLRITSLIIGQEAKNEEGKKSIYGSVYYRYYARNIFELKGKKDVMNPSILHTALLHTDANFSKLYDPMGFRTTYSENGTYLEQEPVRLSEFIEKISQTKSIVDFLKGGSATVADIATAIGTKKDSCQVQLNRLLEKDEVVKLGQGLWGLKYEE